MRHPFVRHCLLCTAIGRTRRRLYPDMEQMQTSGRSVVSDLCSTIPSLWMQQNAALKQRKSRLSIAAAFDPFHFIDKSLDHPIAPRLGTSIDDGFCIVGQSLHKVYQFSNARSPYSSFPLLQSRFPFPIAEKGAKCLSEVVGGCGCRITLAELVNESGLVCCSLSRQDERSSVRHFGAKALSAT